MSVHTPHIKQPVCVCYTDGDHLMACPLHSAAPALLEALEGLVHCNVWIADIDDGDKARMSKARAAIRAAKGD
jgi:hypothetical protein